jgi:hypothetical protein
MLNLSEDLIMQIRTQTENPPPELLKALETTSLHYSDPVCLYHYIYAGSEDAHCGVFGDGDNAAYEWFLWRNGTLETSDAAYGIPEVALRDVLNKVWA